MRVLFVSYPSVAHWLPMVPLASAFQAAGHEVRVASGHTISGDISATGLTPVALGDPAMHEARNRPDAAGPADAQEVLRFGHALGLNAEDMEHWIEFYQYLLLGVVDYARVDSPEVVDLIAFAKAWKPELVIWDAWFGTASIAARAVGAAHGRILFGADCAGWSLDRLAERRDSVAAAGLPENPLADALRPLAEHHGMQVDRDLMVGQFTVDVMPRGYGPTTSITPIQTRGVPYGGAEVFPRWLYEQPQRPRVALSLGESTRRFIPGDWDRAPRIIQAVADLDIDVVATLNALQLQDVPKIPANVRVIEWAPLTHLLPTCSAIIHHGGPGTFTAALALNVPQIVCDTEESILIRMETSAPTAAETGTYQTGREFGVVEESQAPRFIIPAKNIEATLSATFVSRHHSGIMLNHRAVTVDEIGKQILNVVTNPAFAEGAAEIHQTWLATPGPAEVARTLETLTHHLRS